MKDELITNKLLTEVLNDGRFNEYPISGSVITYLAFATWQEIISSSLSEGCISFNEVMKLSFRA